MSNIYPVVIFTTRYGGAYEGDEWAGCIAYGVPASAIGSDPECASWWDVWRSSASVAVGASPGEVLRLLAEKADDERFPTELPREAFDDRP